MLKDEIKSVRILFFCRMFLWLVAAGATVYWMYLSCKLYAIGIHDVHEYASYFRKPFYICLGIAFGAICISLILRTISDKIKLAHRPY